MESLDNAKYFAIKKLVEDFLSDDEIIEIWNRYAERNHYAPVEYNDDDIVEELTMGMTPKEILEAGRDYDGTADYLWQDIEHTFDSWDDPNSPVDIDEVIEELQKSDEYANEDVIKDAFFDALQEFGWNKEEVEDWLEQEYFGNLMEDDWDEVQEEFEEWKYDNWFNSLDFRTLEKITGLKESDFAPDDGSQAFVDACTIWWEEKDLEEKQNIFIDYGD
jgi:hypothetical protein